MKLAALLLLALASGLASAASITVPGLLLCPGYRLSVLAGVLTITNGPACRVGNWKTLRILGMCKGQRFDARTGSLGNLYISCVKR